jgi:magnesium-protoporphyrin O-methyltransferase
MTTCQCQGIEVQFDHAEAARKLADYQKKGPAATTRILVDALKEAGVTGATLLDIGGGIGAVQLELLQAGGVASAVSVEASTGYIETAEHEARRRGLQDRMQFKHGDFVALAADVPAADIVTLDRSVCCYPDMPALVGLSADRARRLYGLVYPRDTWWLRAGITAANALQRLRGAAFRGFVHPTQAVEAVLRHRGLQRRFHRLSGIWQIAVFARP